MRERWLAGGDAGGPASRQQERLASRPPRRPKLLQSSTFEDKVPRVYSLQEIAAPFRLHVWFHLRHTRPTEWPPPAVVVAKQTGYRRSSNRYLEIVRLPIGNWSSTLPAAGAPDQEANENSNRRYDGPRLQLHKAAMADSKPSEKSNGSCDCTRCQHFTLC